MTHDAICVVRAAAFTGGNGPHYREEIWQS